MPSCEFRPRRSFGLGPLLEAYRASVEAGFEGVDTAETMEKFSTVEVAIVPGDERNMKVTFVEDLFRGRGAGDELGRRTVACGEQ